MPHPLQYPLERHREVQRKWMHRRGQATALRPYPLLFSGNDEDGGRCTACNALAPIAPTRSDYRGNGRIDHHWLCQSCGHKWTTSLRVPS